MSTASTASPSVVRSPSRRQPSTSSTYNPPQADRPQRSASTVTKSPPSSAGVGRSSSQNYSRPSQSQQAQLASVARRDQETTNLAQPPSSAQTSPERDRSFTAANTLSPPKRTESTRDSRRTSSRPTHARDDSRVSNSTAMTNDPSAAASRGPSSSKAQPESSASNNPAAPKKRTTITAQTGTWTLSKTIGAGSMGKVKLAKNNETGEQVAVKIVPRQSTDEHKSDRERERADHSKEVRTAREAAIVTLLNHPYICGMRDVQRTNYHWYMLFEYVNGGQMLDYIISHGRLKEKQARKFGRQIASALDYCHRNSIVHRDLKIENILISKTGDIKIIDFGLSNLFAPKHYLKTFCGSLYFAAPELLQARQYTGPEVDIWSFGIVLYVLVCGKVPFDDQSMPQLHAKIKKGIVDYPPWLSPECKSLVSRMLVTDPKQRITMPDILSHPWMTKGFNAPPENYLPHREPLQLPLDPQIIDKMTGFDFGSADYISRELTKVISSEEYQIAVRNNAREQAAQAAGGDQRRNVFNFYKRRSSTTSRDTLPNSSSEAVLLGTDPVNAYSPLISIYYLVKEKQDRERAEANPGALKLPVSPGERPLQIPDLPAPEAAYTNVSTFEMAGEKPTGGRARARSRTHGEDDVVADLRKVDLNLPPGQTLAPAAPSQDQQPEKKEGTGIGILRRLSTRRSKDYRNSRIEPQQTPSFQVQPPTDASSQLRKSFSVRRKNRESRTPAPLLHGGGSTPNQAELLSPPAPRDGRSRESTSMNRSASVNSADCRSRQNRRAVSDAQPGSAGLEPPLTSGSERSSISGDYRLKAGAAPAAEQKAALPQRSATMKARSSGHRRRESTTLKRNRREGGRQPDVPEETNDEVAAMSDNPNKSLDNIKPVYLKGLFSVSTTSNKPLPVIRMDLVRVLGQLGVTWTEIKGGFSCQHAPSIDLHRILDNAGPAGTNATEQNTSAPRASSQQNRRRISFVGGMRGSDRASSATHNPDDQPERSEKPSRLSMSMYRRKPAAQPSNSPTQANAPTLDASLTASSGSESDFPRHKQRAEANAGENLTHSNKESEYPSAGETTTQVQDDFGQTMILKFEIFIVKVPLFSLHGIQFKKVQGGTWQYKEMASKILDALRL